MSTVNGLQSTDFEDESPRISGICTDFWSKVNVLWLYILRIYSRRFMIKSSISSITSGGVSEVLEVSRESVDVLLNKLWFI